MQDYRLIWLHSVFFRNIFFKDVTDLETFTDEKSAIGNGPYEFVKFDESAGTLEFKAYENYIDGKPNVDKIIVKLYANTDTLYMALEKAKLTWFISMPTELTQTKQKNWKVIKTLHCKLFRTPALL